MLTIDQTEQRKSGDQRCSVRSDRIAVDDIASSKIIDFESARQALERDRSVDREAEQMNRGTSNHLLTPSSDGLVESLVTIASSRSPCAVLVGRSDLGILISRAA